jgi:solute carrier family 25 carnitine/acylcarnitine transporter 20/29
MSTDFTTQCILDLIAGSICGTFICISSHPFDTVKVRMQMMNKATFFKVLTSTYRKEGFSAFY